MTLAIIILAVIVLWFALSYNAFIRLINHAKEAWAGIDVQLKRRYDLIPNLVATVKGYATHEAGTLEKVTQARNMAMSAKGIEEKGNAENMLTGALKSVFALSESYPDLKANENFGKLQTELSDTETKIERSRMYYNGNVRELNTRIESFPSNIIASIFKFAKMEFFELEADEEAAKKPVQVKF